MSRGWRGHGEDPLSQEAERIQPSVGQGKACDKASIARCEGERAGRPGQLDPSGLGTVVRSETGGQGQPPGKVRRVISRRGHGVHGRVIGAWGDPSGGCVENGL